LENSNKYIKKLSKISGGQNVSNLEGPCSPTPLKEREQKQREICANTYLGG